VLTKPINEILSSVTIQMKATEQYFPVVLFIMLYKVVLTFEFVDEIPKCDHSNESNLTVPSSGTVYFSVYSIQQQILNFVKFILKSSQKKGVIEE